MLNYGGLKKDNNSDSSNSYESKDNKPKIIRNK